VLDIQCQHGAFGIVRQPLVIPLAIQGTFQTFGVSATVNYPAGKGRMLRFRDGLYVWSKPRLEGLLANALSFVGRLVDASGGSFERAKMQLILPDGVAEICTNDTPAQTQTWWKLGDPPMERRELPDLFPDESRMVNATSG
jgi:hypothetical protein